MTAYLGLPLTWTTVPRPMGLPITASCDTAWNQTRVCSDTSSIEMQCLSTLPHSGALHTVYTQSFHYEEIVEVCGGAVTLVWYRQAETVL